MHCEVLTDPFAVAAPQLLETVLLSLRIVMLNCWPRLHQPPYQDKILQALVMCFLSVHDDPDSEGTLKLAKKYLLVLEPLFWALGPTDTVERRHFTDKLAQLIAKEPALETFFGP